MHSIPSCKLYSMKHINILKFAKILVLLGLRAKSGYNQGPSIKDVCTFSWYFDTPPSPISTIFYCYPWAKFKQFLTPRPLPPHTSQNCRRLLWIASYLYGIKMHRYRKKEKWKRFDAFWNPGGFVPLNTFFRKEIVLTNNP